MSPPGSPGRGLGPRAGGQVRARSNPSQVQAVAAAAQTPSLPQALCLRAAFSLPVDPQGEGSVHLRPSLRMSVPELDGDDTGEPEAGGVSDFVELTRPGCEEEHEHEARSARSPAAEPVAKKSRVGLGINSDKDSS